MTALPKVTIEQLAMVDDFLFDCLLSDDHTFESEVTELPVEDGSNFSDNIYNKPIMVTMDVIVSNTPLNPILGVRDPSTTPVNEAYARLLQVRDNRKPVTIRTSLQTWTSMALKTLSIPRRSGEADALHVTATFKQVTIVRNTRTTRVAVPRAMNAKTENKPAKGSNLVNRMVDQHDGTWYDPDIDGWREGASYNSTSGHWEFFKGRPIHVSQSDWRTKPHLTDAQYKALNDGPVRLDSKKGFVDTSGNRLDIITDPAAIDSARKGGTLFDIFGNPIQ
jgi:hypothetical protein